MKKKITLIGLNYFPEDTAIGLYSTQMMEFLAAQGHEVSVITGFPYYPRWEIHEKYRSKKRWFKETHNGVRIFRYKQYVPKQPTFLKRVWHLMSFALGNFFNLFRLGKQDLVIAIIPPTFGVILGWLMKIRYGSRLWLHVQDFEFEAAFSSELISSRNPVGRLVQWSVLSFERFLLRRATVASSISHSMLKKLRGRTRKEPYFLPNWIDADFVDPENTGTHPLMASDKFKILYSGNIGDKQNWELFIGYVRALQVHEDIEFIVVGDGSKKSWLVEASKNLSNIRLYSPIPYEELSALLCSADIHILFQKGGLSDLVMPSKLLGMMASGVPSLVTGQKDSEVEQAFEHSKGGYFFALDNLDVIVEKTLLLQKDRERQQEFGHNARRYVIEQFSNEKVLGSLAKKISELI